jgi:succinate-acetate transporter protein
MMAAYLAAAELINETHGRILLPIGAPSAREPGLRHAPA